MGQALSYFLPENDISTPAASEKVKREPETPGVTMVAEDPRSPLQQEGIGRTPIQLKVHLRQRFMQDTPTNKVDGSFLEIAEESPNSS